MKQTRVIRWLIVVVFVATSYWLYPSVPPDKASQNSVENKPPVQTEPAPSQPPVTPPTAFAPRTQETGCIALNSLPDPECTPGAVFPEATKEKICISGYAASVRNVSGTLKNKVYTEYSILTHKTGQYEIDHLVSLELGGSNDIANLWPEAAEPLPGFHEKDKVEDYLHDQVCSGAMSLQEAQAQEARDWVSILVRMK
jgi:5-methylcytosine-specific restriction endonuclease McrA